MRRRRAGIAAIERLKAWARRLKSEVLTLWIAARDPRTPWRARLVAGGAAAYALSPIDLIPDFVPVLGYLDDLIIVPLGVALAIRLIPAPLLGIFRERAAELAVRPVSRTAAMAIVIIWLLGAGALAAAWRAAQRVESPPSRTMFSPVTQPAASLHR